MDFDVLERICESSGIDTQFFLDQELNITQLVIGWYESHIAAGGAPDLVAMDLQLEVSAEDRAGQMFSFTWETNARV